MSPFLRFVILWTLFGSICLFVQSYSSLYSFTHKQIDHQKQPRNLTKLIYRNAPKRKKTGSHQSSYQSFLFSGLAEIRTPVRTRKPYVFYMLISAFGFRATARPEPPTVTLSSKFHPCTEAYTGYFRFTCTA